MAIRDKTIEFYQKHLDRVSRSFSFCIQQLRSPLRAWVSLSYLMCRILDTGEDAPWENSEKQEEFFKLFQNGLSSPQEVKKLQNFSKVFPDKVCTAEEKLLLDASQIFQGYHESPPTVKSIIRDMAVSMAQGMGYFQSRKVNGILKIGTLSELNRYCFFVAGVVGEALSRFIAQVDGDFILSPKIRLQSFHFGLFLQKVNILKDQREDESQGRFFVPNREQVFFDLTKNAENAFEYVQSLSTKNSDYKLFCAWSFFLGMATLELMAQNHSGENINKLSRREAWKLLENIRQHIDDNEHLRTLFLNFKDKCLVATPSSDANLASASVAPNGRDFLSYYSGQLNLFEMQDLGLIA